MLQFLSAYLPAASLISGRFIEPFVGGGAIYFYLQPKKALLSDLNPELMDLYRGISENPDRVWRLYRDFPRGKRAYNLIRAAKVPELSVSQRAARCLYLNRTCFKGMWRHNLAGTFNVRYGGESRRWAIARKHLFLLSKLLSSARLKCCDFEPTIEDAKPNDYLFIDPPYRPGAKEQTTEHYAGRQFRFCDHKRLAAALRSADKRGVQWSMTISSHAEILKLYRGFCAYAIPRGTGQQIGAIVNNSGEVLIRN